MKHFLLSATAVPICTAAILAQTPAPTPFVLHTAEGLNYCLASKPFLSLGGTQCGQHPAAPPYTYNRAWAFVREPTKAGEPSIINPFCTFDDSDLLPGFPVGSWATGIQLCDDPAHVAVITRVAYVPAPDGTFTIGGDGGCDERGVATTPCVDQPWAPKVGGKRHMKAQPPLTHRHKGRFCTTTFTIKHAGDKPEIDLSKAKCRDTN